MKKQNIIIEILEKLNVGRDIEAINIIIENKKNFPLAADYIEKTASTRYIYKILSLLITDI